MRVGWKNHEARDPRIVRKKEDVQLGQTLTSKAKTRRQRRVKLSAPRGELWGRGVTPREAGQLLRPRLEGPSES